MARTIGRTGWLVAREAIGPERDRRDPLPLKPPVGHAASRLRKKNSPLLQFMVYLSLLQRRRILD